MSACVSHRYYVQEGHTHTDYRDLSASDKPTPVRIVVDFRQNGVPHPETNPTVSAEVARVLRASRVLWPDDAAPATLTVVMDDVYENHIGRAYWTGITQGLVGLDVHDKYKLTVTFNDPAGQPRTGHYEHSLEGSNGDQKSESKWRPFNTWDEAFTVIVQQTTLDFLSDMQAVRDADEPITFVSTGQSDNASDHQTDHH